jgi:hypothetical protein
MIFSLISTSFNEELGVRFLISGVMVVTLPLPHRELTSIMPGSLNKEPYPIHKILSCSLPLLALLTKARILCLDSS